PEHTLRAFADHGAVARTLDADPDGSERMLAAAAAAGLDLSVITAELEREGVRSFCDSYHQLLACIAHKVAAGDAAAGYTSQELERQAAGLISLLAWCGQAVASS